MDNKENEIFETIADSLEERNGNDRRNEEDKAEYLNPELERRKGSRRDDIPGNVDSSI